MQTPAVSLIAPAARPKLWPDFYENVRRNKTLFEIIFVGPYTPKFRLPENFIFKQSGVKPIQCQEAASRLARGEYLLSTGDDIRYSEGAIDKLYEAIRKENNDLAITSLFYYKRTKVEVLKDERLVPNDSNSPGMPRGAMFKKSTWRAMGGLDSNFVASHGETDLTLRIFEKGGYAVFVEGTKMKEVVKTGEMLWPTYGQKLDHPRLMALWTKDGRFSKARLGEFYPYEDAGILDRSQGLVGTWIDKSPGESLIKKFLAVAKSYIKPW